MTSSSSPTKISFPPSGEEAIFSLKQQRALGNESAASATLVVRHGSSLAIMTQVCEFLANPMQDDAFNYVDPTADHYKWSRKGMDLYYACVVDPTNDDGTILCALRAATKGIMDKSTTSKKEFLIDYVYTAPSSRDKGIAGLLVNEILTLATSFGAACYVLSIEDSAVYWMEKHSFYLVQNPALNARLNLFPDTHLLKRGDPTSLENCDEQDDEEATTTNDENASGQAAFTAALHTLLSKETTPRSEAMKLCLHSLSLVIKNALSDTSEDGRKRRVRINNPSVHSRIFAFGGEQAMNLLLACSFELGTDQQGDTILKCHSTDSSLTWLPWAVQELERESK